jgi:hypothetical protein
MWRVRVRDWGVLCFFRVFGGVLVNGFWGVGWGCGGV